MALNVEVGTITQPGGTGSQSYNLPADFDPKALILQCVARTGNGGGSANALYCLGWATDRGGTAVQRWVMTGSQDNVGTANTFSGSGSADIIKLTDGTTTSVDLEVAFVEFTSTTFVLDWQNLHTSAVVIDYMVLGGSDVTDALAGVFTTAVGATQDVTITAGFGQPDIVFFTLSWNGTDPPQSNAGSDMCFGWGIKSGSTNGRCVRWGSDDAVATQEVSQGIFNNRALNLGDDGVVEWAFHFNASSGWPTDGYEIGWDAGPGGAFGIPFLALKFSADVTVTSGEAAASTSGGGTNTLTSADTPMLALVANVRTATANAVDLTSTDDGYLGLGFVDGSGNERYSGLWDDDGQATASVTGTTRTDAKGIQTWLPSTDTLDGEADIAVSGSDFVATWTDAAPSGFLYEWLTLGVVSPMADGLPIFYIKV